MITDTGALIKKISTTLIVFLLISSSNALAFTDGSGWAAVTYLIKLVEQSVRHYQQLQLMIQYSKEAQTYARQINSGLDASIRLLDALPIRDEKVLGQLRTFKQSLNEVENIYGSIPKSPDQSYQQVNDLAVAESFKMINLATEYADRQELNSASLEARSWDMSPKGAARMQAQVSSQILMTLNQILRMNAQVLKIQSADTAAKNRAEKKDVMKFQRFSKEVASSSKSFSGNLSLPQF